MILPYYILIGIFVWIADISSVSEEDREKVAFYREIYGHNIMDAITILASIICIFIWPINLIVVINKWKKRYDQR